MIRSNSGKAWRDAINEVVQKLPTLPAKQAAYEKQKLAEAVEDAKQAGGISSNGRRR